MEGATVTQFAIGNQDTLKALVLLNPVPLDGTDPGKTHGRIAPSRNDL